MADPTEQGEYRSRCCNAPLRVSGSDEGTNYYVCEKCGRPCDPAEHTQSNITITLTDGDAYAHPELDIPVEHPETGEREEDSIKVGQVWLNNGGERFQVVDNTFGPLLLMLSDPLPRRERAFEASYMRKNMTLESEPRQSGAAPNEQEGE